MSENASGEPHQPAGNIPSENTRIVWTPEDATHFLSAAIQESQRPLIAALARSGVPRSVVICGLITALLLCGGGGFIAYRLYRDGLDVGRALRIENHAMQESTIHLTSQVAASQQRNQHLTAQLTHLKAALKTTEQNRDKLRAEIRQRETVTRKNETRLRVESRAAAQQSATEIRRLREDNIRLNATQPGHTAALTRQINEIDTLKKENAAHEKNIASLQHRQATLIAERDGLRLELEGATDERAALRKQLRAARARLLIPREKSNPPRTPRTPPAKSPPPPSPKKEAAPTKQQPQEQAHEKRGFKSPVRHRGGVIAHTVSAS